MGNFYAVGPLVCSLGYQKGLLLNTVLRISTFMSHTASALKYSYLSLRYLRSNSLRSKFWSSMLLPVV